ncbi:hypothetical protein SISNIDRAFT_457542 [Sistotremastrum niveocremeum HHB9708]|uniref:Uncharacterized protein n=1 Tax=Sistotremastrum niveocremeum HHB9708 TaxID=1314777 RepID=A0A164RMG6_9AGAM|nr:hypothetical protein SISNIDRAFT_457542 [Sistotremastrum niveocremeum HHB9708]
MPRPYSIDSRDLSRCSRILEVNSFSLYHAYVTALWLTDRSNYRRLMPFLFRMENIYFAVLATSIIKAIIGWMSNLHIRERADFIHVNRILKASFVKIITHLSSLDGNSSKLLPDHPSAHIIKSKLPPRPVVLLGPSILSLCCNAKDVDADLAESFIREVSDDAIQAFSSVLVPLWLALQRNGWRLWQDPLRRSSQKIMWSLPLLIGKIPDAVVDAMRELGVTHCGCGTLHCNQGIIKVISTKVRSRCCDFVCGF